MNNAPFAQNSTMRYSLNGAPFARNFNFFQNASFSNCYNNMISARESTHNLSQNYANPCKANPRSIAPSPNQLSRPSLQGDMLSGPQPIRSVTISPDHVHSSELERTRIKLHNLQLGNQKLAEENGLLADKLDLFHRDNQELKRKLEEASSSKPFFPRE